MAAHVIKPEGLANFRHSISLAMGDSTKGHQKYLEAFIQADSEGATMNLYFLVYGLNNAKRGRYATLTEAVAAYNAL